MTIKEELYYYCEDFLERRFITATERIQNIQKSLESETKSSAGDKHETGRAMLQLEREKTGNQLIEIQKQKEIFAKVSISNISKIACLGSLVTTNKSSYFLAVSAGLITIDAINYYAVSVNSPIGKAILGKSASSVISFNGVTQTIVEIL